MPYHSRLRKFYLTRTADGETLFDTWERGAARGDSVTPSTYSPEYRRWMRDLLNGIFGDDPGGMLSIGSGNAVLETEIAGAGRRVLAVDMLDEATEHARSKGLDAVTADVRTWSPPQERWKVVYADGVMGHLYEPGEGLLPVLERVRSWLAPYGGTLVISNDHTQTADYGEAEPAPGVPGFYWLSEEFLRKETAAAGFRERSCATFSYQRPLSGIRDRVVVTADA
jgi:hypothetical protein